MAVHIKLIKNNIKSSSSYGKYFAKTVSQGEVTLDEIAAEACRNSGFSEGLRRCRGGCSNRIAGHFETETYRGTDSCSPWHWSFQPTCRKYRGR